MRAGSTRRYLHRDGQAKYVRTVTPKSTASLCVALDTDHNQKVAIAELIAAVGNALSSCG